MKKNERKDSQGQPVLLRKAAAVFLLAAVLLFAGCAKKETAGGTQADGSGGGRVAYEGEGDELTEVPEAEAAAEEETQAEEESLFAGGEKGHAGEGGHAGEEGHAVEARIELKAITPEGESVVEIPQFVTESGESTQSLDFLNEQANRIEELYDESKEDEASWTEIRTYAEEGERYLQATVVYALYPNYGTEGDLTSLVYDKNTDTAIENKDALTMAGLTGVQLSTEVNLAFEALGMSGALAETEMQGFFLSQDGTVESIYMKLRIEEEEGEPWDGFFAFSPAERTLTKLAFYEEDGGE